MTDFFGHLLGAPGGSRIRPRLPGLFEPVDPGPAAPDIAEVVELPFASRPDPETPEPEPAPVGEPEAPQRSWPVWVRPDEPPAGPGRPENQADRTDSAGERVDRLEIVAPARTGSAADPEPGSPRRPVTGPAVPNPADSAPGQPVQPEVVTVERVSSPPIDRPRPVEITVTGREGPERVIARRATGHGTRVRAVRPVAGEDSEGNPVRTEDFEPARNFGDNPVSRNPAGNTVVEPSPAGNRAPAGQPRVSESEPVIQVSIGRIEVRATAPAPARRATSPGKPPSGQKLADYLRERTEGRR